MITGISGFGFFLVQKWPFRDAHLLFKNKSETPIFTGFSGCALFGPRCQKKEIFGHPQAPFLVFLLCVFFCFFVFFSLFFFVFVFCFFCLFLLEGLRVR